MPQRLQLSRHRGYRKPDAAVVVARPSKWGNPFRSRFLRSGRAEAVERFAKWLRETDAGRQLAIDAKRELRGKDLCCWCKIGQPCHADVLLEIANS